MVAARGKFVSAGDGRRTQPTPLSVLIAFDLITQSSAFR